jgi:hypothetical protein
MLVTAVRDRRSGANRGECIGTAGWSEANAEMLGSSRFPERPCTLHVLFLFFRQSEKTGLVGTVGNAFCAFSKERWTRSLRPRLRQFPQTGRIIPYDPEGARPPRRERQERPAPRAPTVDVHLGEVDRE